MIILSARSLSQHRLTTSSQLRVLSMYTTAVLQEYQRPHRLETLPNPDLVGQGDLCDARSSLTARQDALVASASYSYDPASNRILKNDSGQLTTYAYNATNELILQQPPAGAHVTSSYDSNGNLTLENAVVTDESWYVKDDIIYLRNRGGKQDGAIENYRRHRGRVAGLSETSSEREIQTHLTSCLRRQ